MTGMQTACPTLASRVRWKIASRYDWYGRLSMVTLVLGVTVAMAHQRTSRLPEFSDGANRAGAWRSQKNCAAARLDPDPRIQPVYVA